jgi:hypothetical protein
MDRSLSHKTFALVKIWMVIVLSKGHFYCPQTYRRVKFLQDLRVISRVENSRLTLTKLKSEKNIINVQYRILHMARWKNLQKYHENVFPLKLPCQIQMRKMNWQPRFIKRWRALAASPFQIVFLIPYVTFSWTLVTLSKSVKASIHRV